MRKALIFKIIGIVTASVLAFVGGVVGVMALMGKFRVPVLHPETLNFSYNELVIDPGEGYANPDLQLYSFDIIATNSNTEHEVNQKNVHLWFDGFGSDLIELCDAEGDALQTISKTDRRYLVECNTTIFYKLKNYNPDNFDETSKNNGKVVLMARSERGDAATGTPLTIWIDRKVENIYVANIPSLTDNEHATQEIVLGLDESKNGNKYISYYSVPNYALHPIGKEESAKVVELYFDSYTEENEDNDYVLVNAESIEKYSDLKEIVGIDNKGLYFKSTTLGNYEFKLAVFDTYSSYYERDPEEMNFDRMKNMVITTINVSVVNADIDYIEIDSPNNEPFNLFGEDDYIVLNAATSGVDGAKDINLGLKMYQDSKLVSIRENEATLKNDFRGADPTKLLWSDAELVFKSINDDSVLDLNNLRYSNDIKYTVKLSENAYLINQIDYVGVTYACSNGAAVYVDANADGIIDAGEIKKLKVGTYIDFYSFRNDIYEKLYDETFAYDVIKEVGEGANRAWNVQIKTPKNVSETIKIGVLVVNNDGTFDVSKLFATNSYVQVEEIDLRAEVIGAADIATLDLTFKAQLSADGSVYESYADCETIPFENIVRVTQGSYNTCVLAVKLDAMFASYQLSPFEILNIGSDMKDIQIGNDQYAIVGYFETNADGEEVFVNALKARIKDYAKVTDLAKNLCLLQFKYNGSAADAIKKDKDNDKIYIMGQDIDTLEGKKFTNIQEIQNVGSTSLNIKIDESYIKHLVDIAYTDNPVAPATPKSNVKAYQIGGTTVDALEVVETLKYKMTLRDLTTSESMKGLVKVLDFYCYPVGASNEATSKVQENMNISASALNNLNVTAANYDTNKILTIEYEANLSLKIGAPESLDDFVEMKLQGLGDEVNFRPIFIQSSAPSAIKYVNAGGSSIDITESSILTIFVDYDTSAKTYTYTAQIQTGADILPIDDVTELFNKELDIVNAESAGFHGVGENTIAHTLTYGGWQSLLSLQDKTDYYEFEVLDSSSAGISRQVSIGIKGKSFNLTLTVKNKGSFALSAKNGTEVEIIDDVNIKELIKFEYTAEGSSIPVVINDNLTDQAQISNIVINYFGAGEYQQPVLTANGWNVKDKEGYPIFSINKFGTDWKVVIDSNYKNTSLNFTFKIDTIVTEAMTITLKFTPRIAVDYNPGWPDRTIYQGTEVVLYDTNFATTNTNPLISITGSDLSGILVYKMENGIKGDRASEEYAFTNLGEYEFGVYSGGQLLTPTLKFVVVPNLVVEQKDIELNISQPYTYSSLFKVGKYSTSTLYGSSTARNYSGLSYFNTDVDIKNNIDVYYNNNKIDSGSIKPSWIEQIGAEGSETFVVKIAGTGTVLNVKLLDGTWSKNATFVSCNDYTEKDVDENNFKALEEHTITWAIDGDSSYKATAITLSNGEVITLNADKFTYGTAINQSLKIVSVKFENGTEGKEMILDTTGHNLNIVPYVPEKANPQIAYTTKSYNALTNLYTGQINDGLDSIRLLGIYDEKGTDITSIITASFSSQSGKLLYKKGESATPDIVLLASELNQQVATFKVAFIYTNGVVYEELREVTILNAQQLTINYPFGEIYKVNNISSLTVVDNSDVLKEISSIKFEPLWIGVETSIDFNKTQNEEKLYFTRAKVVNQGGTTNLEKIASVELVAYQNIIGLQDVIGSITYAGSKITFRANTSGTYGLLIFKVLSTTNAYDYYGIYISTTSQIGSIAEVDKKVEPTGATTYESVMQNMYAGTYIPGNVDMYVVSTEKLTEAVAYASSKTECSVTEVASVDVYTKQTVVIVYRSSTDIYVAGYVTLFIQPTMQETLKTAVVDKVTPLYKEVSANKSMFGTYNYEISADTTSIECPFNGVTLQIASIPTNVTTFVTKDGDDGLSLKQVENETKFTIVYSNGNFKLVVNYTYNPIDLPDGENVSYPNIVGMFNNGFNSTVDLVSSSGEINAHIFGAYKGRVDIYYDGSHSGGISLTKDMAWASGKDVYVEAGKLVFTQSKNVKFEIVSIKYLDVAGAPIKKFTFTVKENYLVLVEGDGANGNSLETTLIEDNYNSNVGSTLGYEGSIQNSGEPNEYYQYRFGGYKIYSVEELKIKVPYVVNGGQSYFANYPTISEQELTGAAETPVEDDVNFVHLAGQKRGQDASVELSFDIKIYNDTDMLDSRVVTARILPTYETLVAKYMANGAKHENVVSQELNPEIADIHAFMFEDNSSILSAHVNACRLALSYVKAGENKELVNSSILAMGFNVKTNPNYLTFYNGEHHSVNEGVDGKYSIKFEQAASNSLETVLTFGNNTGIDQVTYNFYIQKDGLDKDDIDLSGIDGEIVDYEYVEVSASATFDDSETYYIFENGTYVKCVGLTAFDSTKTYFTRNPQKVAFVVADIDNSVDYDHAFKIGTITDDKNAGLINVSGKIGSDSFDRVTTDEYLTAYKIENANYSVTIAVNTNLEIYLLVHRPKEKSLLSTINITGIQIFGTSGYIIEDMNISIYNHNIIESFKDADKVDRQYAGHRVKLSTTSGKAPFVIPTTDIKLVLDYANSSYSQNTIRYPLTKALLEYDDDQDLLILYEVGSNVDAILKFNAQINGVTIKVVTYRLTIIKNHQFTVNGEVITASNQNDDSFDTFFVLTNDSSNFPLSYDLTSNITSTEIDKHDTDTTKTVYYKSLRYSLFILNHPDTGSSFEIDQKTNVSITYGDEKTKNLFGSVVEIDNTNKKIIFKTDYNGEICLLLSYKTDVGSYDVRWYIHVTGIMNYEYKNPQGINGLIVKDNSRPFSSGDSVNILSDSTAEGVGILSSYYVGYGSNITNHITSTAFITYTYQAKYIYNSGEDKSNQELFDDANAKICVNATSLVNKASRDDIGVSLPFVPVKSSAESYIVIYEIKAHYLNGSRLQDTFYVAYVVQNIINVTNQDANICIDDSDYINGSKLKLFYYAEVYTATDGTKYTMISVGGGDKYIQKADGSFEEVTEIPDVAGEEAYCVDEINKKIYYETAVVGYVKKEIDTTDDNALLSVSFKNFDQFDEYMTNGRIKLGDYLFEPKYTAELVYAIDLSSPVRYSIEETTDADPQEGKVYYYETVSGSSIYVKHQGDFVTGATYYEISESAAGAICKVTGDRYEVVEDANYNLFTNELVTDLVMTMNNNEIFRINAYNKETNTGGFRLYSQNTIEAWDSVKLSQIFSSAQLKGATDKDATDELTHNNMGAIDIIGFGNANFHTYIENGADGEAKSNVSKFEIKVGDITYSLLAVEFGRTAGAYYNIGTTMYVIDKEVINKDILDLKLNVEHFLVDYQQGEDEQKFELAGHIIKWSFVSNIIKSENVDDAIISSLSNATDPGNDKYGVSNTEITIDSIDLQAYKNLNVYETKHIKQTLTIDLDGTGTGTDTMTIEVLFALPENVVLSGTYAATTPPTVSLFTSYSEIKICVDGAQKELDDAFANGNITKITEMNTTYIKSTDASNGDIMYDTALIGKYFESNPGGTLQIVLELQITGSSSVSTQKLVIEIKE